MATVETRIEVRNLDMAYGERVIQHDLAFTVRCEDIFIIMGSSGCGKSTLLRHLIGLIRPARDDVLYDGESFWDAEPGARDRLLRRFGVLYQGGAQAGAGEGQHTGRAYDASACDDRIELRAG